MRPKLLLFIVPPVVAITATLILLQSLRYSPAGEPLPLLGEVPDFSLTERGGGTVTRADLAGKVWVADFIFTHCAGPCPRMSSRMSELQKLVSGLSEVRLVSVSVDPERDTPDVLASYADRYRADPSKWLFLTGEKSAIHRLIREGFRLAVDDGFDLDSSEPGPGIITHSVRFVLVDQEGRIRGYYDGTEPGTPKKLLPEIERLLET